MCCRCCSVTQQRCWVFGLGTISLIFGLVLSIWGPQLIDSMVYKQLPLTPSSRTYDMWKETSIPIYIYFYLFNWTNTEDAYNKTIKPHFERVGPYVFREVSLKTGIVWHPNNTVTYKTTRNWYFEPELTNGTMDDLITAPHLPSIAASDSVRDSFILKKIAFNAALNFNGGALYQTHTTNEWLFEGFYDEFLHFAMSLDTPETEHIKSDHFGWFLDRNGTNGVDGAFTIHTGKGDLNQMGDIKFWNGRNHTGFFDGECGRINGSASELWVPNRDAKESITIYVTDTCRIMNLEPTGEIVVIEGIEGEKYESKPNTFDNGQQNEDMKCYCPADLRAKDACPPRGATNMQGCADGAPMYLSNSNFLYADEHYANTITGMNPSYENDNYFIVMQRKLGIPMQVNAMVQISLHIQEDPDITILRGIPSFYAPLFVINSRAVLSAELAKDLRLVLKLPTIMRFSGVGMACCGFILIVIGIVLNQKRKWYRQAEQENDLNEAKTNLNENNND